MHLFLVNGVRTCTRANLRWCLSGRLHVDQNMIGHLTLFCYCAWMLVLGFLDVTELEEKYFECLLHLI